MLRGTAGDLEYGATNCKSEEVQSMRESFTN